MKQDKQGNKIYIYDDGVYLKLIGKGQPKRIFSFNSGRIIKYVTKGNIMRKPYPALGFNYNALMELSHSNKIKNKNIHIRLGSKYYKVPIESILQKKEFFHFKDQGFELQCFFPFSQIMEMEVDSKGKYKKVVFNETKVGEQECLSI